MDISSIRSSRNPIRQDLGRIDDLIASIQERGLLNPIVVRPTETGYEIVAGNRRHSACRRLRWMKIPCHVVDVDNKTAYELSITENIQHETLTAVETAHSFKRYVDDFGYGGISELARKIGKSEQYVSQYLQLLKLPENVLQKLSTRVVTISQARELTGLNPLEQSVVAEEITKKKLSSRGVKRIAYEMKKNRDEEGEEAFRPYSEIKKNTQRMLTIERTLNKCIASLKASMLRFDEIIEQTDENEWILREALTEHRMVLHRQIDSLLKFRRTVSQLSKF